MLLGREIAMPDLTVILSVAFGAAIAFAYVVLPYIRRKWATSQLSAMLGGSVEVNARTKSFDVIITGSLGGHNARATLRITDDASQSTATLELMTEGALAWMIRLDKGAVERQRTAAQNAWAAVDGVSPTSPIKFASPHDAPNVVCVRGYESWSQLPAALRQSIAQMVEGCRSGATFEVSPNLVSVLLDLKDGTARFRRGFELMEQVAEYHEGAGNPHPG